MNNITEFPMVIGTNINNASLYDFIADCNYRNSDVVKYAVKYNKKSTAVINEYTFKSETTFSEIYTHYNCIISDIISKGFNMIYARNFVNLSHMRICTMICKEKNIPIMLTLLIDDEGMSCANTSIISATITLQALGASAIGFSCDFDNDTIYKILKKTFHHSEVPIILDIPYSSYSENLSIKRGGAIFFLNDTYKDCEKSIIQRMHNTVIKTKTSVDSYAAAIDREVFFLGDDIILTKQIECSGDLSEVLMDYEDEMVNALLINISSKDDADYLLNALTMVKLPIAIHCHNSELLDYVLKHFNGRAIIDSASDIDTEYIKKIANKYGAIVY